MKIDLCKLFGVEEGEEFEIELEDNSTDGLTYRVIDNSIEFCGIFGGWDDSGFYLNDVNKIKRIIKKTKQFTDDELCILRNVDKEWKWIARDEDGNVCVYSMKPFKVEDCMWDDAGTDYIQLNYFNHLFKSIKWEDEEPVFIDDYIER